MSGIYPVRLLAGVALAAIGCGEAPAETRTAAPVAVAAPVQTQAFDRATVERMLRSIFATYTENAMGNGSEYYSAEVEAMIENLDVIEYEPICGCQDAVRLNVHSMRFAPGPDGRLDAMVTLSSGREAPSMRTFRMVKEPRGWRIDDILEPGMDNLRDLMISLDGVAPPVQTEASDQAAAERMLRSIFAAYTANASDYSAEVDGSYYSAEVEAMFERDEVLEFDPICDCQDIVRLDVRSIRFAPGPNGSLDAEVIFAERDPKTFRLVKEPRGWRIDDILWVGGESLRRQLKSGAITH